MKFKTTLIIVIVFNNLILPAKAQISIPATQIDIAKYNEANNNLKELKNDLDKKEDNLPGKEGAEKANLEKEIKETKEKINNSEGELKKIFEDESKFSLYGNAALATSDQIADLSAITNVLGVINFSPRFIGAIGFNIKGVQPESVSKDSIDLNNLMFPDAGNAGFFAALNYDIAKKWHAKDNEVNNSLNVYFDFAFKQTNFNDRTFDSAGVETGSTKYSFSVLNYNWGVKYRWSYRPKENPKNNVDLTAQVYLNVFNIPQEDENKFNRLYADDIDISYISSIGFKAVLSFRGVSIFGDFRGNMNTKELENENVLKGFVFNIGTRFTTEIIGY